MSWEGFKSLLLAVLVLLSFLLTWKLWTYETHNNHVEKSNFVSSAIAPSDGKRKLGGVVHPDKAIVHENGHYYGLMPGSSLKQLFQVITSAQYHDVTWNVPSFTNPKLKKEVKKPTNSDGIVMTFPTAIPASLFGAILQGSGSGKNNTQAAFSSTIRFDRVVFYKDDQEQTTKLLAYFKNGENTVGTAKISNVSFADLKHFYPKDKTMLIKKKDFYFLADPKLKELDYYAKLGGYKWIDVSKFKRALFDNPNYVVEQSKNYFASSSQIMQVKDHILQFSYSEPGTQQTNKNSGPLPVIQTSFNYIESHSGWTDDYMLFGYQYPQNPKPASRGSVFYRLMIGQDKAKYPVFGKITEPYPLYYRDAGTMKVILEKGSVYKYMRTLMDLGKRPDYSPPVNLETGEEIWGKLTSSKHVQMKFVTDIRVGYQINGGFPPKQDVESFKPEWFVLYKGQWVTAKQLISSKSKDKEQGAVTK